MLNEGGCKCSVQQLLHTGCSPLDDSAYLSGANGVISDDCSKSAGVSMNNYNVIAVGLPLVGRRRERRAQ